MKILLLIGLPGSGKSTLGMKLHNAALDGTSIFLDDISKNTSNAESFLFSIKEKNPKLQQLIISDVYFCFDKVREKAIKTIEHIFPNSSIEFVYFENSIEKCLANIERRRLTGDDRKVSSFVLNYSKNYIIPNGVTARCITS